MHTLPVFEILQRAIIGIEVGIARDAADAAGRTDLPIGPATSRTGIDIIATGAAAPWIARVEILSVPVGYPGRQRAGGVQVAHSIACARINNRMQEMRG